MKYRLTRGNWNMTYQLDVGYTRNKMAERTAATAVKPLVSIVFRVRRTSKELVLWNSPRAFLRY